MLVYPFCLTTNELGNRLGNYFTEVGCAYVAGVDLVTVHSQWDVVGTHHGQNLTLGEKVHFLKALPEVIVHPNKVGHYITDYHRLSQTSCFSNHQPPSPSPSPMSTIITLLSCYA